MGIASVVDSPRFIMVGGKRVHIVQTGTVRKMLGITKVTLYKWIDDGVINAMTMTSESGKKQFVFDIREVERIKKGLNRKWKPGDKKFER